MEKKCGEGSIRSHWRLLKKVIESFRYKKQITSRVRKIIRLRLTMMLTAILKEITQKNLMIMTTRAEKERNMGKVKAKLKSIDTD